MTEHRADPRPPGRRRGHRWRRADRCEDGPGARPGAPGFTLVELLVVIAVLAVLAAVAVPLYLHQREKARDAVLRSEVKRLADSVQMALLEPDEDLTSLFYLSARGEGGRRIYLMRGQVGVGQEELGRLDGDVVYATQVWVSSGNVALTAGGLTVLGAGTQEGLSRENWCVDLLDRQTGNVIRYSAQQGMEMARCTDPA
jgi:prepilin-type N-terminal cleavage/methylation domain-containing protein